MPLLRLIPSIDQLLQRPSIRALEARYGRAAVVDALRDETAALRRKLGNPDEHRSDGTGIKAPAASDDSVVLIEAIERSIEGRLTDAFTPSLRPVINATGVIIHTNLGRAPLASSAVARVAEIASGYSNLEYDLDRGRRGARDTHAEALLVRLTGAEAAVVVNNNAAATILILSALAKGREVIISRGELVEIGGGFRVPDIMAQSGAILREVGTTNRTRAADYAAAVGERTALILRVHPSNFRIEGFTERPALEELVAIAHQLGVPIVEDLGSGNLLETWSDPSAAAVDGTGSAASQPSWNGDEPLVQSSLQAGADLVCFSGDKLLGGPQAGIIAGRKDPIAHIRRHPLMRALRVDKMTYAALEATLLEYSQGRASTTVPVARAIAATPETIERRSRMLADRLAGMPGLRTDIIDGVSTIGGGSAPGAALPTRLLAMEVEGMSADALEEQLRRLSPPVIGRIENDRLVLDLRTVLPEQDGVLGEALGQLKVEGRKLKVEG